MVGRPENLPAGQLARAVQDPAALPDAAGEAYELQMMSADVVHAFSIQMGNTSYNAVVMPKAVTTVKLKPTKPGKYLVIVATLTPGTEHFTGPDLYERVAVGSVHATSSAGSVVRPNSVFAGGGTVERKDA